jgi:hypothetical protein
VDLSVDSCTFVFRHRPVAGWALPNCTFTCRKSQWGSAYERLCKSADAVFDIDIGCTCFSFYQFTSAPVFFNEAVLDKAKQGKHADSLSLLEKNMNDFRAKNTLDSGI